MAVVDWFIKARLKKEYQKGVEDGWERGRGYQTIVFEAQKDNRIREAKELGKSPCNYCGLGV